MDQVKKGSSIFLAFFFKRLSAIKGKSIKGLDSPAPGPVRMTRARLHRPKLANCIICAVKKNRWTTVLYQNDSSDQIKKEKMTFKFNGLRIQFGSRTKRSLVR